MADIGNNEKIEYDILIQASQALVDLRNLTASARNFGEQMKMASAMVKKFSSDTKMSIHGTVSLFRELDGSMSRMGKGSTFGQMKNGWNEVEKSAQGASRGINAVRIAWGAMVAMGVFAIQQAITGFFSEATKQARELEETMNRLANAERILSEAGQEITLTGLEEGITRIQKLLPIFSREDISQLVGQIALGTQQLGYTEEQILALTQATLLYNIQSTKQEDVATTAEHLMSAILGKSSQGIAQLGVSFNKTEKEAAALSLGLIEQGESLDKLTDNQLAAVKLAILMKGANVDNADALALLNKFLDTNTAKIQTNTASWKDLLTFIGQGINNLIPDITKFVEELQKAAELSALSKLFTTTSNEDKEKGVGKSFQDAGIWFKMATGIKLTVDQYARLKEVLSGLSDEEILKIFPNPAAIKDRFTRELVQSLVDIKDTATNTAAAVAAVATFEDAEAFGNKIEDILEDAKNAREDLENKFGQKKEDLDLEYIRKGLDAERDYARKVEDINRDAEREVAKIKEQHRHEDEKAEQDYQLRLWELRMRYLMDLEDALHARDARQVIRLQKQYAIDKEALEKKHTIDGEQRNWEQRRELEDIELKREQRLEDAKIEYEQKLADLNTAKARELEDLNTWYAREQADLAANIQRKLEALIAAGIQEGTITEANASLVYGILRKYLGPGGLTDELYKYMNDSIAQAMTNAGTVIAQIGSMIGSIGGGYGGGGHTTPTNTDTGKKTDDDSFNRHNGMAPRPAGMFGSIPSSIPVNQIGRNNQGVSGSNLGRTGMEGAITVEVSLSPDLEARVVQNSMDGVANVISRVTNSK